MLFTLLCCLQLLTLCLALYNPIFLSICIVRNKMVRPSSSDKMNVKKRPWTDEGGDAKMPACVSKHGTGDWTALPRKPGPKRCNGKSSRLTNHTPPDLKQDGFTAEEEELIIKLHAAIGSRWTMIAHQLPGRTDNEVKAYWNTKLRKKLKYMGIDPVTHKPYSQILADYENIEGLSNFWPRVGSNHNDLITAVTVKAVAGPYSSLNPSSSASPPSVAATSTTTITAGSTSEGTIQNSLNSRTYGGNYSADLLTQLQSITLVTEASISNTNPGPISPPSFFTKIYSPSSPDHDHTTDGKAIQEAFCWRNFLMEEAFQAGNELGEEVGGGNQSGIELPLGTHDIGEAGTHEIITTMDSSVAHNEQTNDLAASSSEISSFVEAMLDQESAMFINFPGLIMEEPLYC